MVIESVQEKMAASPLVVRRAGSAREVDFGRRLEALFGLPFDAIDVEEAAAHLRLCAREGRRCFLSTPNINFVMAAQTDTAFRDSVLRSDLSLADGMPLVWVARLLGLRFPERVAGSDLFEHLRRSEGLPMAVYFFGGQESVAERACAVLNAEGGGVSCVGHASPGFGSVEDMSNAAVIEHINASGADFVVVSIGAKKGQAWIERNIDRLNAPIVGYLGAVANFVAGGVNRAPPWLRRTGLEWAWRIKEEPALWRRYGNDGMGLMRLLGGRVLPALRYVHRPADGLHRPGLELFQEGSVAVLRLSGAWNRGALAPLRSKIAGLLREGTSVQLDLRSVVQIDAAVVALLMQLDTWQSRPRALLGNVTLSPAVLRVLHHCCADFLLE